MSCELLDEVLSEVETVPGVLMCTMVVPLLGGEVNAESIYLS